MKFTFRVTVMTILLSLVFLTVAALGIRFYFNARFTADNLTEQILDQTSLRIDDQINDLLFTATRRGSLDLGLLQAGQIGVGDFPKLATYWLEVMKVFPKLTRLSVGLEATGEWFYVRRDPCGRLALGELRRQPRTGKLELRSYWPEDYPHQPFYTNLDMNAQDPRRRPWSIAARTAQRQAWSETYVLFGTEGAAEAPGITCATPVYAPDGKLVAVLDASFELDELCQYLKGLSIGRTGYAFVVEFGPDGRRQVIAHPDRQSLLHVVKQQGHQRIQELVPVADLDDQRVAAFLSQLPQGIDAKQLTGLTQVRFQQGGVRYIGGYRCLSTQQTPDWLICIVMPESDVLDQVEHCNRETVYIGLGIFVVAVLVSLFVSAQVARPLERLAQEAAAIGQLRLEAQPVAHSLVLEVDHLAEATEEMKTGLRSFQKYVPADLVRTLMASGQEARLGGERRTVTVYFGDIVNFTGIAEELSPEVLVEHLSEYLNVLSQQIRDTGGTVDKYIGDAIMAFWGAPTRDPQHALGACTAALRNQQKLVALRREWQAKNKPRFATRIGLNTGEVVVGNIGSEARLNYTVIGDAVNLASRLEGLNKYYGTEILLSERTYQEARSAVVARPVDLVSVKGKAEAVLVYELVGLKEEVSPADEDRVHLCTLALDQYRQQHWERAIQLFAQVLRLRADDGPAQLLLSRCQSYQETPPGADWDGVHHMDSK